MIPPAFSTSKWIASDLRIDFDRESDSSSEEARYGIRDSVDPNLTDGKGAWHFVPALQI